MSTNPTSSQGDILSSGFVSVRLTKPLQRVCGTVGLLNRQLMEKKCSLCERTYPSFSLIFQALEITRNHPCLLLPTVRLGLMTLTLHFSPKYPRTLVWGDSIEQPWKAGLLSECRVLIRAGKMPGFCRTHPDTAGTLGCP